LATKNVQSAGRASAGGRKGGDGKGGHRFLLAVAAVAVAGIVGILVARGSGGESEAPVLSVAETTAVEADPAAGKAIGPEDASIVIMEFSDYLCPHCRTFNSLTGKLLRQNYAQDGGPLRWVSYEFPLWPESVLPALAARCADEQGRYWDFHDLLFARVDSWRSERAPTRKFAGYARDLGLDGDTFDACMAEQRTMSSLMASRKYGEQLGVGSTPTLFVDGELLPHGEAYGYENLERAILAAAEGGGSAE
jgi:protein-disulfide isomerase